MEAELSVITGCLLGLAVGDAMGYTVDRKTYAEICQDYGPAGLLGYDLVNGYAEVSSHTQLAAFISNGLLLAITRGQTRGRMSPYVRYIGQAMREWAQCQRYHRDPEKRLCWVCRAAELRHRTCLDTRLPDTLSRERLGTMEEPVNRLNTPGSLVGAIPVGLFFHPDRMEVTEVGRLGAETVALTHGDPETFLSGAVLAYAIAGIVQDRQTPLKEQFSLASEAALSQFGREYPQAKALQALIHRALFLAENTRREPAEVMEQLELNTAAQVLAGAMYACLVAQSDFDRAMTVAVNHSGRSAAVGAVTGALLGAALGMPALPEFYLECLEPADVLRELAQDLHQGCPMVSASRLFDDDWDRKYTHGERVEKEGWYCV